MTDLRKAAEMALEALEISNEVMMSVDGANDCSKGIMAAEDAIESIRTALAQPESIKPSDLLIDTYSVNLGAWSVNNRGVKITHVPTGTVVCSDSERSQHANKRVAMQKLEAALAQPEQRENRMTDREAIQKALDTPHRRYSIEPHGNGYAIYRDRDLFHHGFNLGHLTEVTPETIELIENALNTTLAYPEQEPTLTEKDGSPCPEFWDWLPKAYNFEGLGEFTKYNMEVAFLAGKNTALAQPEQAPFGYVYEINGTYTDFSKELPLDDGYDKGTLVPVFTAPPSKPWQSLTDEEIPTFDYATPQFLAEKKFARAIEAKLKEKNNG